MPVFFFVSSIIAGLSMVIFEGTLSHKAFLHKMDGTHLQESDGLVLGFGKAAALVLAGYFTIKVVGITAAWTVAGIVLNRLNVSVIAFNYHLPLTERYFPHWMEIGISVFMVTMLILVYRFIVTRMPILYEHPDYKANH